MTKAMGDEPRALLRDPQILRQLGAGDALLVGRDKPDRQHPSAERQFAILKDGADTDGKPLAAVAALVRFAVGEMIDFGRLAMRTERAVFPPDAGEMVNRRLFVGDGLHHLEQAVESRRHRGSPCR